jgi:hypothetical protein
LNTWTKNGTQDMPVEFINKNVFARIPPIDANNVSFVELLARLWPDAENQQAVIIFNIFYQGTSVVPTKYTTPLLAIGPAVQSADATDYPGLTTVDGTRITDAVLVLPLCLNMTT